MTVDMGGRRANNHKQLIWKRKGIRVRGSSYRQGRDEEAETVTMDEERPKKRAQ